MKLFPFKIGKKSLLQTVYDNESDLLERVRMHVERGDNLNKITKYCESALRVASNNARNDVVKYLIDSGADASQLEWTDTFFAVAFGDADAIRDCVGKNHDLEHRDFWSRTAFLLAVQLGDVDKAKIVLELGADKHAVGRCDKTPFQYAIQTDNITMIEWLLDIGLDINATDEFLDTPLIAAAESGMTESAKYLLERGADISKTNHIPYRAIEVASNVDIVKLLVEQGEDINDISEETHAMLVGIKADEPPDITKADYEAGRKREFGLSNPEKIENKFYLEMIKSGASAWKAREKGKDKSYSHDDPVWSYQRFGRSTTIMPDGRIIEIAGEHEDYYDPDFCIYNDVIVFSSDGDIDVFVYPEDVFPPTDFHSATLTGETIYIIGSLGYSDARTVGYTPVYRLNTVTMAIEKVDGSGDMPGWISRHKAKLLDESTILVSGGEVYIESDGEYDLTPNSSDFTFDVRTGTWAQVDR